MQLIGDSLYLGENYKIRKLAALNGKLEEVLEFKDRIYNFTISNNELFVIGDEVYHPDEIGLALNPLAATPKKIELPLKPSWSLTREFNKLIIPAKNSLASDRLFSYTNGFLECLEMSGKGRILWRRMVSANIQKGRVIGDKLLLLRKESQDKLTKHILYAYNIYTGKFHWQRDLITGRHTPLIFTEKGFIAYSTNDIQCYDLLSGNLRWHHKINRHNHDDKSDVRPIDIEGALHVFRDVKKSGIFHYKINLLTGKSSEEVSIKVSANCKLASVFRKGPEPILNISYNGKKGEYSFDCSTRKLTLVENIKDFRKRHNYQTPLFQESEYRLYRSKNEISIFHTQNKDYSYTIKASTQRPTVKEDLLFFETGGSWIFYDLKNKKKLLELSRDMAVSDAIMMNSKLLVLKKVSQNNGLALVIYNREGKVESQQLVSSVRFMDKFNSEPILILARNNILITSENSFVRTWTHNPNLK